LHTSLQSVQVRDFKYRVGQPTSFHSLFSPHKSRDITTNRSRLQKFRTHLSL